MLLKTNPARTQRIMEILLEWYYQNPDGIYAGSYEPELILPKGTKQGSYEQLMFYTLTVAIDYQRSASDLWDAGRRTMEDEKSRWVFYPKEVAKRSFEELVENLAKYKLSKKTNRDAKIWQTICLSLLELFEGNPRKLFEKYDYDALQIFNAMRSQYGKKFPYLAGSTGTSKILSLWIRILHEAAKIEFKNLNQIPMPIDIHTARATITTGCLVGDFKGSFNVLVEMAKSAWVEACQGTKFYPLRLDEALWNLSRNGCSNYTLGKPCPVRNECKLANFCTANNSKSKIILRQNDTTTIDTKYP